jgi:excisionase family DNA binding protein
MQLTLEQAATRLGKSRRQVLYMIRQQQLPAQKISGHWFIDSDDLPTHDHQRRSN